MTNKTKDNKEKDLGEIKILKFDDGHIELDFSDMKEKCNKFLEERRKNK